MPSVSFLDQLLDRPNALAERSRARAEGALTAQQQAQQQAEFEAARGLAGQFYRQGMGPGPGMDPAAAQAVGLMQDPGSRGLGIQQGMGLLERLAKGRTPEQDAALQGQVLSNTRTAQDITAQGQSFPLEQQLRQAELQARGLGMQGERQRQELTGLQIGKAGLELNAALLSAASPKPVLPFGDPPKGTYPATAPDGSVQYIPQPGTGAWNQAQDVVAEQERLLQDLNLFQSEVEKVGASGTEYIGPQATNLALLRGNVISRLAKLRNLGVLQPTEYATLDSQLPDPTSLLSNYKGLWSINDPTGTAANYVRETIQAPYTSLRRLSESRLRQTRQQYWYVNKAASLPEDAR